MTYNVNDIFREDNEYTARAIWCNENDCYISEIDPLEDGTRQFKICAVERDTEAEQEQMEAQLADLKDQYLVALITGDSEKMASVQSEYQSLVGA